MADLRDRSARSFQGVVEELLNDAWADHLVAPSLMALEQVGQRGFRLVASWGS